MIYTFFSVLLAVLAAFLLYKTVIFLWKHDWFLGWFRGMAGLALLAITIIIALIAWDIFSYKQLTSEQYVCNVNFKKLDEQHFVATLTDRDGKSQQFELRGDQWQIDARIVKWKGWMAKWGVKPAYRLDRISGRYFDLEKETTSTRTAHAINSSVQNVDVWVFINKHANWLSVIDAIYGNAAYLPMRDKANFEVTLSNTGLVIRPVNEAAREAVSIFN